MGSESEYFEFIRKLTLNPEVLEIAMHLKPSSNDPNQYLEAFNQANELVQSRKSSRTSLNLTTDNSAKPYSSSSYINSFSNLEIEEGSFRKTKPKIYIDGSNVALNHGNDGKYFSWAGIRLCVDWFVNKKHDVIKVIVPENLCGIDNHDLNYLKDHNFLLPTPTGFNDDEFILQDAFENKGLIVSNDQFRNETFKKKELKQFVDSNRLAYIFDDGVFMISSRNCGPFGPTTNELLSGYNRHSSATPRIHKDRKSENKFKYASDTATNMRKETARRSNVGWRTSVISGRPSEMSNLLRQHVTKSRPNDSQTSIEDSQS